MPTTDPNLGGSVPTVQVEDMADPLVGSELGGFQVVKLIASGGMGLVYEALHPALGRRAAVKVLKPEVAADAEWTRRFISEARAIGSLKHRNLIEVLNFGKTKDGREFLMMEFLDGEPLDAYIRRLGQLPPAAALGIVDQILNGLAEAHKKGVVHRDLKPSNVYLLREHNGELLVKVLDFGLARHEPVALMDVAVNLPRRSDGASLVAGTPEYIAPEQAQGRKVDASADLYSLGVMLYEMLSGQLPFQAESVTSLLQKHLSERPPRVSTVVSNLPEGVEEFLETLLEKEPEKRPGSADAARVTVQRLLKRISMDATAVRMRPMDFSEDAKKQPTMRIERDATAGTDRALAAAFPQKKRATPVLIALVLLLLLLGGYGVYSVFGHSNEEAPVFAPKPEVAVEVPAKPAEAPQVAAVEPPDLTEIAPLAPIPPPIEKKDPVAVKNPAPVPNLKLAKKDTYTVEVSKCEPSPEWRRNLKADIHEMENSPRVTASSEAYARFEEQVAKVSPLIDNAHSVSECAVAQEAFEAQEVRGLLSGLQNRQGG